MSKIMDTLIFMGEKYLVRLYQYRAKYLLKQSGGVLAVSALQRGFQSAERYRRWDGWSLSYSAIFQVAILIARGEVNRIVEFGAGFSTIALAEFLSQTAYSVTVDSFEHQAEYAVPLNANLSNSDVKLNCVNLLQLDDERYVNLFTVSNPNEYFHTQSTAVPQERYGETRLRNAFYDYDYSQWPDTSVDLIILDGPNGNGRSIAFPLLRDVVRIPGWILIDDYLDYPFLDDLRKVFKFETIYQDRIAGKEHILVKVFERV